MTHHRCSDDPIVLYPQSTHTSLGVGPSGLGILKFHLELMDGLPVKNTLLLLESQVVMLFYRSLIEILGKVDEIVLLPWESVGELLGIQCTRLGGRIAIWNELIQRDRRVMITPF